MKDLKHYRAAITIFTILFMAMNFFIGNLPSFILSFLFIFLLLTVRTLVVPSERKIKAYLIVAYAGIAVIQLVICVLITFGHHHTSIEFYFCKFFSVVTLLCPFVIERFVTINRYAKFYLPSAEELATVSFSEMKRSRNKIINALESLERAGKSFSIENLTEITEDLPRHNSFEYISKESLPDGYFDSAYASMGDPHLYIIISNTGSAASEIISTFTQKQYNHASLSFDYDLETIISYNGGEHVYTPGLNHEMIAYFNKKEEASIIVYALACSAEQKKMIIDKVREINDDGSAYNMLGLVLKYSHKSNIMFCSQFVYKMLQLAGLAYFQKKEEEVKPTDLVELDYYRKLQFAYEIHLKNASETRCPLC